MSVSLEHSHLFLVSRRLWNERGSQWKPAREGETTTIFSFQKSIFNHLHEVVGAVRRGVRVTKTGWES
jgi:hypothetical protein